MTGMLTPDNMIGRTAVDPEGNKIGKIGQVYLDDSSGQPSWLTVSTGMFGTRQSFAPLQGAVTEGDDVRLPVSKDQVKDAPNVEDDGHLSPQEEQALYDYYAEYVGGGYQGTHTTDVADPALTDADTTTGTVGETGGPGHDTSGPNTDNAMTRSEEQLYVGTEQYEAGRARLRKYVVTENVTQTVPVSHEEVRIEREPITDANAAAATDGPAISEEEHEVTLHAERPVTQKEAVPVERVRLDTDTVTEQATVDEDVRKEQIDTDVDGTTTPPTSA
jgi:uncharacterized protein (TIGR02271 family)